MSPAGMFVPESIPEPPLPSAKILKAPSRRTCLVCRKRFTPNKYNASGRYCSDECRAERTRERQRLRYQAMPKKPQKPGKTKPKRVLPVRACRFCGGPVTSRFIATDWCDAPECKVLRRREQQLSYHRKDRSSPDLESRHSKVTRAIPCITCGDVFESEGPHHRMCWYCRNHAKDVYIPEECGMGAHDSFC